MSISNGKEAVIVQETLATINLGPVEQFYTVPAKYNRHTKTWYVWIRNRWDAVEFD